jgi:hypothetical protein
LIKQLLRTQSSNRASAGARFGASPDEVLSHEAARDDEGVAFRSDGFVQLENLSKSFQEGNIRRGAHCRRTGRSPNPRRRLRRNDRLCGFDAEAVLSMQDLAIHTQVML